MADTAKKLRPADVCDVRSDTVRICDAVFNDYGARAVFQGTIVTVSSYEDNTLVREVLETDGAGKVLVVDGGGSRRHALMGGDVAALAAASHWEGVVFNGCIRDAHEIAEKNVGIKALGINPRPPLKKGRGEVGLPVCFRRRFLSRRLSLRRWRRHRRPRFAGNRRLRSARETSMKHPG